MKEVMIDIETLATSQHAIVVSIGAVRFDAKAGTIGGMYYQVLNRAGQYEMSREINLETIDWWMRQSNEARQVFDRPTVPADIALSELNVFVKNADAVWANPPVFDLVILRSLYQSVGLNPAWHWSKERCFRTLNKMVNFEREAPTVAHNALDDAIAQAKHVIACYKSLGL